MPRSDPSSSGSCRVVTPRGGLVCVCVCWGGATVVSTSGGKQNGGRRYYARRETSTVAASGGPESRAGAEKPAQERPEERAGQAAEGGESSPARCSSLAKFSRSRHTEEEEGGWTLEAVCVDWEAGTHEPSPAAETAFKPGCSATGRRGRTRPPLRLLS